MDFLAVRVNNFPLSPFPSSDVLVFQDEASLDRIKRRNLLDRAQALLTTQLVDGRSSMSFREALGSSSSLDERQQRLSDILREKRDKLSSEAPSQPFSTSWLTGFQKLDSMAIKSLMATNNGV
jgi:hypothetical protein